MLTVISTVDEHLLLRFKLEELVELFKTFALNSQFLNVKAFVRKSIPVLM